MSKQNEASSALGGAVGSAPYAHEWTITVKADDPRGAMAAVWRCWESWREGSGPVGGCVPERMGERMSYDVRKTKSPALPNTTAQTAEPMTPALSKDKQSACL